VVVVFFYLGEGTTKRYIFFLLVAAAAVLSGCNDSYTPNYFESGNPASPRVSERPGIGKIYFISNYGGTSQLFEMNDDGTNTRQITHDTTKPIYAASLSKDETMMIVECIADTESGVILNALYSVSPSNGELTIVFKTSLEISDHGYDTYMAFPRVSPDDKQIAFAFRADLELISISNIFIVNTDGSGGRQVTDNYLFNDVSDWSNDGLSLLGDDQRR
jgi:Tol biopolymer transport system component